MRILIVIIVFMDKRFALLYYLYFSSPFNICIVS